ncbi:MAG: hypothetical protein EXR05_02890 [Acetobacteraceae bacterium]|nr:hypothetical protein [Acetobacteraceae bacterium]
MAGRILLLDEATSALNTESKEAIQTALTRLRRGRTILLVARRLFTVRDADLVVAMAEIRGWNVASMANCWLRMASLRAWFAARIWRRSRKFFSVSP